MFEWLARISITCFAASYLVVLGLEVSRLFFRLPVRMIIIVGFGAVGVFAHVVYLLNLAREEFTKGALFTSWHDWCVLAALCLAVTYLILLFRRPDSSVGLFVLPMALLFIGVAVPLQNSTAFARAEALSLASIIHGLCMLFGTVSVSLGLAAGLMYFAQWYRLKRKMTPGGRFRLPSLEWLQKFNRETLYVSAGFVFVGLLCGFVMNLNKQPTPMPWNDPVIVSSSFLFLWLVAVSLFEYFYKPARQGHKVAYLTLCSFVFLSISLFLVLSGKHGSDANEATSGKLNANFPVICCRVVRSSAWGFRGRRDS
ncbi:MAG TPA: cytochrome C assembly protein [Planctomycetaceae bacterium]|nr:cytochrome C assembly protein [Blastopirellula sp.]HAY81448.1 cytochrome C assembly protein [Planctomycetaceae bacterium]